MIDETSLKAFLEDELGADLAEVENDSLLFSTGIIDSFALVNMMMFLETEGGFRISPADVNLENLDSIDRILAFVKRSKEG
ncbi:acyl carrier protein [Pseudorhodobacter aquimaris]|uniref:acyl carrier protein n=1 Tax=Pseudorhodobacter aquimaris TaxID=687412 RepID=UPI00067A787C|nr:acyl carrier protein [Pseudorhodobacter aquimaris]